MIIKLGTLNNETEIEILDRVISVNNKEVKDVHQLIDGSLGQYFTAHKKVFSVDYRTMINTEYDKILAEFDKHTSLSLKIETAPDSGVYNNYTVLFTQDLKSQWTREMNISGTVKLYYDSVSFELSEV